MKPLDIFGLSKVASEDDETREKFERLLRQPTEDYGTAEDDVFYERSYRSPYAGGWTEDPTTGELMDITTDSERWGKASPDEPPPHMQNSSLDKLIKATWEDRKNRRAVEDSARGKSISTMPLPAGFEGVNTVGDYMDDDMTLEEWQDLRGRGGG